MWPVIFPFDGGWPELWGTFPQLLWSAFTFLSLWLGQVHIQTLFPVWEETSVIKNSVPKKYVNISILFLCNIISAPMYEGTRSSGEQEKIITRSPGRSLLELKPGITVIRLQWQSLFQGPCTLWCHMLLSDWLHFRFSLWTSSDVAQQCINMFSLECFAHRAECCWIVSLELLLTRCEDLVWWLSCLRITPCMSVCTSFFAVKSFISVYC